MATQKEKIIKAQLMAHSIISMAKRLRNEAKDYDVKFPIAYADNLENIANEFLNKL